MSKFPFKSGGRWADESADMSPDFRPAIAPKIADNSETIFLDDKDADVKLDQKKRAPRPAKKPSTPSESWTISINNLSFTSDVAEIKEFFGAHNIKDVRIQKDRTTGRSRGQAYVDMVDQAAFDKALSLHHKILGGRSIQIASDRPGDNNNSRRSDRVAEHKQPETPVERKKLVLAPRTKPIEDRPLLTPAQGAPRDAPVAAQPVQQQAPATQTATSAPATQQQVQTPQTEKKRRDNRNNRKSDDAPKAAPVVAPVEVDDFVQAKKKGAKVVKAQQVQEAPKPVPAASLKNRFAGFVETDSDN